MAKKKNIENEVETQLNEDITSEKEYINALNEIQTNSLFAQHSSKPIPAVTPETTAPAGDTKVNFELLPGVVTVDENQLNELMDQNITMKTEIGLLISLFKNFESIITGKNIASLMLTLPKLINNPEITKQIDAITPIIEKYSKID